MNGNEEKIYTKHTDVPVDVIPISKSLKEVWNKLNDLQNQIDQLKNRGTVIDDRQTDYR